MSAPGFAPPHLSGRAKAANHPGQSQKLCPSCHRLNPPAIRRCKYCFCEFRKKDGTELHSKQRPAGSDLSSTTGTNAMGTSAASARSGGTGSTLKRPYESSSSDEEREAVRLAPLHHALHHKRVKGATPRTAEMRLPLQTAGGRRDATAHSLQIDRFLGRRVASISPPLSTQLSTVEALEAAAARSLRMEYLVQYEQRSFVHAEWLPREAIEAQGWRSRAKLQQYILECRARGVRDGAPIAPAISATPVIATGGSTQASDPSETSKTTVGFVLDEITLPQSTLQELGACKDKDEDEDGHDADDESDGNADVAPMQDEQNAGASPGNGTAQAAWAAALASLREELRHDALGVSAGAGAGSASAAGAGGVRDGGPGGQDVFLMGSDNEIGGERLDAPQPALGTRIEILWPGDGQYYGATIKGFNASSGEHEVLYDEGTRESLNLQNRKSATGGDAWREIDGAGRAGGETESKAKTSSPKPRKLKEHQDGEEKQENIRSMTHGRSLVLTTWRRTNDATNAPSCDVPSPSWEPASLVLRMPNGPTAIAEFRRRLQPPTLQELLLGPCGGLAALLSPVAVPRAQPVLAEGPVAAVDSFRPQTLDRAVRDVREVREAKFAKTERKRLMDEQGGGISVAVGFSSTRCRRHGRFRHTVTQLRAQIHAQLMAAEWLARGRLPPLSTLRHCGAAGCAYAWERSPLMQSHMRAPGADEYVEHEVRPVLQAIVERIAEDGGEDIVCAPEAEPAPVSSSSYGELFHGNRAYDDLWPASRLHGGSIVWNGARAITSQPQPQVYVEPLRLQPPLRFVAAMEGVPAAAAAPVGPMMLTDGSNAEAGTDSFEQRKPNKFFGVERFVVCGPSVEVRYSASIIVGGSFHRIGAFADPTSAALAYDRAARLYHSSRRRVLNFPSPEERQLLRFGLYPSVHNTTCDLDGATQYAMACRTVEYQHSMKLHQTHADAACGDADASAPVPATGTEDTIAMEVDNAQHDAGEIQQAQDRSGTIETAGTERADGVSTAQPHPSDVASAQPQPMETGDTATNQGIAMAAKEAGQPTSRYRGVYWAKRSRKWCAQIRHLRNLHHLGMYNTQVEAAEAYDRGARKLKGTEAILNFPVQGEDAKQHNFSPQAKDALAADGSNADVMDGSHSRAILNLHPSQALPELGMQEQQKLLLCTELILSEQQPPVPLPRILAPEPLSLYTNGPAKSGDGDDKNVQINSGKVATADDGDKKTDGGSGKKQKKSAKRKTPVKVEATQPVDADGDTNMLECVVKKNDNPDKSVAVKMETPLPPNAPVNPAAATAVDIKTVDKDGDTVMKLEPSPSPSAMGGPATTFAASANDNTTTALASSATTTASAPGAAAPDAAAPDAAAPDANVPEAAALDANAPDAAAHDTAAPDDAAPDATTPDTTSDTPSGPAAFPDPVPGAPCNPAQLTVGSKIETLWPDDGTWYKATVQSFDSSSSKHELLYDEGTVEEIDLSTLGDTWRLVELFKEEAVVSSARGRGRGRRGRGRGRGRGRRGRGRGRGSGSNEPKRRMMPARRRKRPGGTTNYRGVTKVKNGFQSQITFLGINHYLGKFRTPEDGAVAYDIAARHFYVDDDSHCNFKSGELQPGMAVTTPYGIGRIMNIRFPPTTPEVIPTTDDTGATSTASPTTLTSASTPSAIVAAGAAATITAVSADAPAPSAVAESSSPSPASPTMYEVLLDWSIPRPESVEAGVMGSAEPDTVIKHMAYFGPEMASKMRSAVVDEESVLAALASDTRRRAASRLAKQLDGDMAIDSQALDDSLLRRSTRERRSTKQIAAELEQKQREQEERLARPSKSSASAGASGSEGLAKKLSRSRVAQQIVHDRNLNPLRESAAKIAAGSSRRTTGPCTSRFRGVTQQQNGKWRAQIYRNGSMDSLGSFDTEIEAAVAYDSAARLYRGRDALCNFPDGIPGEDDVLPQPEPWMERSPPAVLGSLLTSRVLSRHYALEHVPVSEVAVWAGDPAGDPTVRQVLAQMVETVARGMRHSPPSLPLVEYSAVFDRNSLADGGLCAHLGWVGASADSPGHVRVLKWVQRIGHQRGRESMHLPGPLECAGVQIGDVLISVNGQRLDDAGLVHAQDTVVATSDGDEGQPWGFKRIVDLLRNECLLNQSVRLVFRGRRLPLLLPPHVQLVRVLDSGLEAYTDEPISCDSDDNDLPTLTNVNKATAPFQGAEQTLCSYICGDIARDTLVFDESAPEVPPDDNNRATACTLWGATLRNDKGAYARNSAMRRLRRWLGGQLIATEAACQGRLCELTHTPERFGTAELDALRTVRHFQPLTKARGSIMFREGAASAPSDTQFTLYSRPVSSGCPALNNLLADSTRQPSCPSSAPPPTFQLRALDWLLAHLRRGAQAPMPPTHPALSPPHSEVATHGPLPPKAAPEGCAPQWCVLADARGLPSRAPVAMALQYLCRNEGLRGPYLVIAHQTTISDWLTAFSTWAPSLVVISPPNKSSHAQCDLAPAIERFNDWWLGKLPVPVVRFNVMLLTYEDLFGKLFTRLKAQPWELLTADANRSPDKLGLGFVESQAKSQRPGMQAELEQVAEGDFSRAADLLQGLEARRRVLVTALPLPHHIDPTEPLHPFIQAGGSPSAVLGYEAKQLHSVLRFIEPHRHDESLTDLTRRALQWATDNQAAEPHAEEEATSPEVAKQSLAPTTQQLSSSRVNITKTQLRDFYCHAMPVKIKDAELILNGYKAERTLTALRDDLIHKYGAAPVFPHFFGLERRQQEYIVALLRAHVNSLCCADSGTRTLLRRELVIEQHALWRTARSIDEQAVTVRLTRSQKRRYTALYRNAQRALQQRDAAHPSDATQLIQQLSCCCAGVRAAPSAKSGRVSALLRSSSKLCFLYRLFNGFKQSAPRLVAVVSHHTAALDAIAELFTLVQGSIGGSGLEIMRLRSPPNDSSIMTEGEIDDAQQREMDGLTARVRSGAPGAKHGLVLVPSAANRIGEDMGGQPCDALGVCLLDADSIVVLDHNLLLRQQHHLQVLRAFRSGLTACAHFDQPLQLINLVAVGTAEAATRAFEARSHSVERYVQGADCGVFMPGDRVEARRPGAADDSYVPAVVRVRHADTKCSLTVMFADAKIPTKVAGADVRALPAPPEMVKASAAWGRRVQGAVQPSRGLLLDRAAAWLMTPPVWAWSVAGEKQTNTPAVTRYMRAKDELVLRLGTVALDMKAHVVASDAKDEELDSIEPLETNVEVGRYEMPQLPNADGTEAAKPLAAKRLMPKLQIPFDDQCAFWPRALGQNATVGEPFESDGDRFESFDMGGERFVLGDAVVFAPAVPGGDERIGFVDAIRRTVHEEADTDQRQAASDTAGGDRKESLDGDELDVDDFSPNESRLTETHDVFVDVRWLQTAAQLGVADLVITKMKGAGVTMSKADAERELVLSTDTPLSPDSYTESVSGSADTLVASDSCTERVSVTLAKRPASLYFCNARESMPTLPEATDNYAVRFVYCPWEDEMQSKVQFLNAARRTSSELQRELYKRLQESASLLAARRLADHERQLIIAEAAADTDDRAMPLVSEGTAIEVFWPSDSTYHRAEIVAFDWDLGVHRVKYTDEEQTQVEDKTVGKSRDEDSDGTTALRLNDTRRGRIVWRICGSGSGTNSGITPPALPTWSDADDPGTAQLVTGSSVQIFSPDEGSFYYAQVTSVMGSHMYAVRYIDGINEAVELKDCEPGDAGARVVWYRTNPIPIPWPERGDIILASVSNEKKSRDMYAVVGFSSDRNGKHEVVLESAEGETKPYALIDEPMPLVEGSDDPKYLSWEHMPASLELRPDPQPSWHVTIVCDDEKAALLNKPTFGVTVISFDTESREHTCQLDDDPSETQQFNLSNACAHGAARWWRTPVNTTHGTKRPAGSDAVQSSKRGKFNQD